MNIAWRNRFSAPTAEGAPAEATMARAAPLWQRCGRWRTEVQAARYAFHPIAGQISAKPASGTFVPLMRRDTGLPERRLRRQ